MNSARQTNHAQLAKAGGFTLIELLVTISIIALLMGILLPVIPRARDLGRMAGCGARLRSVGQAITLYINNNKDAFPIANYTWWNPDGAVYDPERTLTRPNPTQSFNPGSRS